MTSLAAVLLGIPWAKIGAWLVKSKFWLIAVLKPLGAWGILLLCFVDSASIPLPFMDPLIVSYGVASPAKAIIYCFMAAVGSALGSLVPYYLGRAGGELFLLKRINRPGVDLHDKHTVEPELVVRETTCAAPDGRRRASKSKR